MPIRHPIPFVLSAAALVAALGLTGCQQDTDDTLDAAPPVAEEPAGTLEPDPTATPEMPGDAASDMGGDPTSTDPMATDPMAEDMPEGMTGTEPTALDVTSIALGTEVGPDDTIAAPQDTFSPEDEIVVAIDTDGAASEAELSTRLIAEDGQTAGEQSETITTTGAETTTVTFSNEQPWPAGTYTVEVWVDGAKAETTELTVE